MTGKNARTILVLVFIACAVAPAVAQELPAGVSRGLREYQAGEFETALASFGQVSETAGPYAGYAEFWIARSLMALNRFQEAADGFDLFLDEFEPHPYRQEAEYQRARLFYLSGEYEAAIQRFGRFLQMYPESDFTANALYWTGEALFSLGRLDESRRFFEEVTERHTTSFRVEAARYRLNVIDLKRRENELLTLLQWSHEEYLAALEEFRQKERAYQDALEAYRDRLSSLAEEDFRQEILDLNGRIAELEATVSQRDARINELLAELRQARTTTPEVEAAGAVSASAGPVTGGGAPPPVVDVRAEILSLKAEALELQQRLMQQGATQ